MNFLMTHDICPIKSTVYAGYRTGDVTYGAADAAVSLSRPTAATVAPVIHGHLQTVLEPHGLDGEALVCATRGTAPRLHAHVERHLEGGRTSGKDRTYNNSIVCCHVSESPDVCAWRGTHPLDRHTAAGSEHHMTLCCNVYPRRTISSQDNLMVCSFWGFGCLESGT